MFSTPPFSSRIFPTPRLLPGSTPPPNSSLHQMHWDRWWHLRKVWSDGDSSLYGFGGRLVYSQLAIDCSTQPLLCFKANDGVDIPTVQSSLNLSSMIQNMRAPLSELRRIDLWLQGAHACTRRALLSQKSDGCAQNSCSRNSQSCKCLLGCVRSLGPANESTKCAQIIKHCS